MYTEVKLKPPENLMAYWQQIDEGWRAFFDNMDSSDNPYLFKTQKYKAWKWGFFEGMDYGN